MEGLKDFNNGTPARPSFSHFVRGSRYLGDDGLPLLYLRKYFLGLWSINNNMRSKIRLYSPASKLVWVNTENNSLGGPVTRDAQIGYIFGWFLST